MVKSHCYNEHAITCMTVCAPSVVAYAIDGGLIVLFNVVMCSVVGELASAIGMVTVESVVHVERMPSILFAGRSDGHIQVCLCFVVLSFPNANPFNSLIINKVLSALADSTAAACCQRLRMACFMTMLPAPACNQLLLLVSSCNQPAAGVSAHAHAHAHACVHVRMRMSWPISFCAYASAHRACACACAFACVCA